MAALMTIGIYLYRFVLRGTLKSNLVSLTNGNQVIILGNGPSLKTDINQILLNKCDFLVVNFFALSDFYLTIRPRFYVLSDGNFFIPNRYSKEISQLYKQINEITTWDINFYVPYRSSKHVNWEQIFSNPKIRVRFYNDVPYEGTFSLSCLKYKLYAKGWANIDIWNVIQASIMLTILLGYKSIHLYGVDSNDILSIAVNSNNQVGYTDGHFYDDSQQHPFRVCLLENGESEKLSSILYRYYKTFFFYLNVADYAEKRGCVIVNHTKNSLIDSFKRSE